MRKPGDDDLTLGAPDLEIPQQIVEAYRSKGVSQLFQWQKKCIHVDNDAVLNQRRNLIYVAPTSAGKTLVSELLLFKCISKYKRSALVILPYISIVCEKAEYFKRLCLNTNFKVKAFYCGSDDDEYEPFDIGVCTIEKANTLCDKVFRGNLRLKFDEEKNQIIVEKETKESAPLAKQKNSKLIAIQENLIIDQRCFTDSVLALGIIIVDEFHVLSDDHRGYILEIILTKVKYFQEQLRRKISELMCGRLHTVLETAENNLLLLDETAKEIINSVMNFLKIQVVGMSATLSSVSDMCEWLDASFYESVSDRPIPLFEYYYHRGFLYKKPVDNCLVSANLTVSEGRTCLESLWSKRPFDTSLLEYISKPSAALTSDYHNISLTENTKISPIQKFKHCLSALNPLIPFNSTDQSTVTDSTVTALLTIPTAFKENKSVLVFCPTKKQCSSFATSLSRFVLNFFSHFQPHTSFLDQHENRLSIASKLRGLVFGLENEADMEANINNSSWLNLATVVLLGIGIHHSALSIAERKVIEQGYGCGALLVLVATSTVAAGVNLPASLVVFKTPYIGSELIDPIRYKQMSGRAGRTESLLKCGRSVIVLSNFDSPMLAGSIEQLMTRPFPPIFSSLHYREGIYRLLLEVLRFGKNNYLNDVWFRLGTSKDIVNLASCTLYFLQKHSRNRYVEQDESHDNWADDSCLPQNSPWFETACSGAYAEFYYGMHYLLQRGLVEYNDENRRYVCTNLGSAIVDSGLTPLEGFIAFETLKASDKLVIRNPIQIIALITPFSETELVNNSDHHNSTDHKIDVSNFRKDSLRKKTPVKQPIKNVDFNSKQPEAPFPIKPKTCSPIRHFLNSENRTISNVEIYSNGIRVDWFLYSSFLSNLKSEKSLISLVGIDDLLVKKASEVASADRNIFKMVFQSDQKKLGIYQRFYTTIFLYLLFQKDAKPTDVTRLFGVTRGQLQNIILNTIIFASKICNLCHETGFWIIGTLINELIPQLNFLSLASRPSKDSEFSILNCPLAGVNSIVARELFLLGYGDVRSLGSCNQFVLEKHLKQIFGKFVSTKNGGDKKLVFNELLDSRFAESVINSAKEYIATQKRKKPQKTLNHVNDKDNETVFQSKPLTDKKPPEGEYSHNKLRGE